MQIGNGMKPDLTHPIERRSGCFGCGQDNPNGLKLRFQQAFDETFAAEWIPTASCEGAPGIVHGGIISTALDEAMSKAAAADRSEAPTAELRVRYKQLVRTDDKLVIRGWVIRRVKRLIEAEATLTDADGVECAHGWASFLIRK
jgi:acyl-coenzyme A thioesterase PaaI-like protein